MSLGEQIKAAQASMATWPKWLIPEYAMNGHEVSAFPLPEIPERHPAEPGMSLWDYFAAHAPLPNAEALDCLRGNSVLTAHVMWACHYADAMMTERARRVSEGPTELNR